jgi:4'-phosphopantetheinyl transferase EntD
MIDVLLPVDVACAEMWGDDPFASLLTEETAFSGRVMNSRVKEFTTARTCARRALLKLGLPPSPILRGPHREPLWPPGVVGSITHCNGYRAAAVAKQQDVLTVGIDAEIHDELPAGVLEQALVDEERYWLAQAPEGIHWDRLIFSAKESVYKAWFPLTGRWLGFEDAVVTFKPMEGVFHARLLPSSEVIPSQMLTGFAGRFLVREGLVLTAITLPGHPGRNFGVASCRPAILAEWSSVKNVG